MNEEKESPTMYLFEVELKNNTHSFKTEVWLSRKGFDELIANIAKSPSEL